MNATAARPAEAVDRLVVAAQDAYAAGRRADAARMLEQALAQSPAHAGALHAYAVLALEAGKPQAALAIAQRWIAVAPADAEAYGVLGLAQRHAGRLADSAASLARAVALAPDAYAWRTNLSAVLLESGDATAAVAEAERAVALRPDAAAAHNNLGNAYRQARLPGRALASYRRAVECDPRHALAWNNVGTALRDAADVDGALTAFRTARTLAPDRPQTWSNLLLTMAASDRVDPAALAAEHRAFGAHFAARSPALPPTAPQVRTGRPLRVGFVSPDFRRHAVATFFGAWLDARDRATVAVHCYFNGVAGDAVTAAIQQSADHFVPVAGMTDAALAARIRADEIDVLVDLAGHTADNRLPLFFLAPAPVQATWLGYLGGTGVPAMRWRISDATMDPPAADGAPGDGLEPVWRLPHTLWCYRPYPEAPPVAPPPAVRNGYVTFGCLNNAYKLSPTIVGAWARLLARVPTARLTVLGVADADATLRQRFVDMGVDGARIEWLARQPVADYLAAYARVDVALDTWPYGGGTTTCDALWMGVPVVTYAAARPFARSAATVLAQVGLTDLVATTLDDYVERAAALAADAPRRAALRGDLRATMGASPLMDAAAFARDFDAALGAMHAAAVAERRA
ncbi:MAG: tetratricopeptide repeat protein [Proteobacteria bacterium]|nr:tetratricopeptide repeat protein [Pseudomonadota bacterium]